jgi:hypothetical protein
MILHPGILTLLLGSGLVLLLMLVAAQVGLLVLLRWDPKCADEEQLQLERRTYLVSTLVNYALGFTVFSLFIFLYTVDDMHPLFVGAMCATGTLNANPIGWQVLIIKLALALLAALWVVVNHYDMQAEDFPLVKVKYLALILLLPLVIADLYLQLSYFLGLNPEIITSCCGSLFSSSGAGVAADLSGWPPRSMMIIFYAGLAIYSGLLFVNLYCRWPVLRYLLALVSCSFLLVSLASVVSFISLYIYELPTHHCPFDMLQQGSNYIGYPLYLGLVGATFCGIVPAFLEGMSRVGSLSTIAVAAQRRWLWSALLFLMLFTVLASWPVLFGRLSLQGYF